VRGGVCRRAGAAGFAAIGELLLSRLRNSFYAGDKPASTDRSLFSLWLYRLPEVVMFHFLKGVPNE
jgi:hypothetical protein